MMPWRVRDLACPAARNEVKKGRGGREGRGAEAWKGRRGEGKEEWSEAGKEKRGGEKIEGNGGKEEKKSRKKGR